MGEEALESAQPRHGLDLVGYTHKVAGPLLPTLPTTTFKIRQFRPMAAGQQLAKSVAMPGRNMMHQPSMRSMTGGLPAKPSPNTSRYSLAAATSPNPAIRSGPAMTGNVTTANISPGANAPAIPKAASAVDDPWTVRYQEHGEPMTRLLDTSYIQRALAGSTSGAAKTASAPAETIEEWVAGTLRIARDISHDLRKVASSLDDPTAAFESAAAVKLALDTGSSFGVSGLPTGKQVTAPIIGHGSGSMSTPNGKIPVSDIAKSKPALPPPPKQTHSIAPPASVVGTHPPVSTELEQHPSAPRLEGEASAIARPNVGEKVMGMKWVSDAGDISGEEMRRHRSKDAERYFEHGVGAKNVANHEIPAGMFAHQPASKLAGHNKTAFIGPGIDMANLGIPSGVGYAIGRQEHFGSKADAEADLKDRYNPVAGLLIPGHTGYHFGRRSAARSALRNFEEKEKERGHRKRSSGLFGWKVADEDLKDRVQRLKRDLREHEEEESPEDERRESEETQRLERALGTEKHNPDGTKKASRSSYRVL